MENEPRVATHLGPFSPNGDRYNPKGYHTGITPEERIRQAATVKGLNGLELNFRGLVNEDTAPNIKSLLDEVGMACANVSMNVWGDGKWGLGSLSNPDAAIRRDAGDVVIQGMKTALGGILEERPISQVVGTQVEVGMRRSAPHAYHELP